MGMNIEDKAAILGTVASLGSQGEGQDKEASRMHAFGKGLAGFMGNAASEALSQAAKKGIDLGTDALLSKLRPKPTLFQQAFGPGSTGRRAIGLGAMAAGVGAGVGAADKGIDALTSMVGREMGFRGMLQHNPDLAQVAPKSDLKRFYTTLHKFGPQVAEDPVAAGAWMKKTLEYRNEGVPAQDLKLLSDINKNMRGGGGKGNKSILQNAFDGSMTAGGLMG
jgi:hypothetical protein